jgi:hypothetical protein
MDAMVRAGSVGDFETRLADPPDPGSFAEKELEGLPDPVRRYLAGSIAPGTPLARAVRFRMRGSIKLGRRWMGFRAREILAPHHGFLWAARAGGVIAGFDRYADGAGTMDWKLFGLVRVAHADGPDVARSAAGRAGAEAVWLPTALLPRFGVNWAATDTHHVVASYCLDDTELELQLELDDHGRLCSVVLERWGDTDASGSWGYHRFGFEATGHARFGGVTIASAGRAGWHFGTDRWAEGEFFRYELSDYELVTGSEPSRGS